MRKLLLAMGAAFICIIIWNFALLAFLYVTGYTISYSWDLILCIGTVVLFVVTTLTFWVKLRE